MVVVRKAEQARADHRSLPEVEWRSRFAADEAVDLRVLLGRTQRAEVVHGYR